MSDLSSLSTPLLPGDHEPYAWPTPELAGYAAPAAPEGPPHCCIEGLNGRSVDGELTHFDPANGGLQMRVNAPRRPLPLRMNQFRRLHLVEHLKPLQPAASGPDDNEGERALAAQRPLLPFEIEFKGAATWHGLTVVHHEEPWGLFLFEPVDEKGTLRRWFVPRAAYSRAEVGPRIGQALVDQHSATPDQIRRVLAEQTELRSRKLGDMLVVRQIITPEELAVAIEQQARMPMVRIGEALSALGFITEAQLEDALVQQRSDRSLPLGELLLRQGLVSRADLQTALARKMGYPLVDVEKFPADPQALARLPRALACRMLALPLMVRGGRLVLAVEDPTHRASIEQLAFAAQCKVLPVLARTGMLLAAIERAYGESADPPPATAEAAGVDLLTEPETAPQLWQPPASGTAEAAAPSPEGLRRWLGALVAQAHAEGVSDIHLDGIDSLSPPAVRWRRDGTLAPVAGSTSSSSRAVIGLLRTLAGTGGARAGVPARIAAASLVPGLPVDLMLSTVQTSGGGEDAVLHLQAPRQLLSAESLGLNPRNQAALRDVMRHRGGLVLCVGPTGSGKRSTLHALLSTVNTPQRRICTAEDPVDIVQPGLRQVQVDSRADWNFVHALRALAQADPDVILVGALRDTGTAELALQVALGGPLVLSTLPSGRAAEAVARLLDMGLNPFNLADALACVLAQRLVRRLCPYCSEAHEASAEEEEELLQDHLHGPDELQPAPDPDAVLKDWRGRFGNAIGRFTLRRPRGCPSCRGSGYIGRTGLHELLLSSRTMRQFIQTGHRAASLQRQAIADGMLTMRQDGIEKVLSGVTTIEEVRACC